MARMPSITAELSSWHSSSSTQTFAETEAAPGQGQQALAASGPGGKTLLGMGQKDAASRLRKQLAA